MADINGESTDRIPIDTNPYTARVLARGSATLTAAAQGGGIEYFADSEIVDLSAYDFATIVPEAEVYVEFVTGDLSTGYAKAPWTNPSSELTADSDIQLAETIQYSLQRGSAKSAEIHGTSYQLRLVINYYSNTNASSRVVHWQIKSTEAAPF